MTVTFTFDLMLLYLVAINVIAILAYVLFVKERNRRLRKRTAQLTAFIADYFRQSGVGVIVECLPRRNSKRYVAIIDSEPQKRFRYSHIVEISLHNHVAKALGIELERVYWRFPIMARQLSGTEETIAPIETKDDYLSEGLSQIKGHPGYAISEGSWEQFSAARENAEETRH